MAKHPEGKYLDDRVSKCTLTGIINKYWSFLLKAELIGKNIFGYKYFGG